MLNREVFFACTAAVFSYSCHNAFADAPPLEEMLLMSDGRVLVTNRNDDTVSIVDNFPVPCPADLTGDDQVDSADLALLLGSWGPCPPQADCPADLNGDLSVDAADVALLLGAWGDCG